MKFPYSQMLLPFCMFCIFNAKGQNTIDPQRIAQINASINLELSAEEQNWMFDQSQMENDEKEFCRDTFRINHVQCNLLSDWDGVDMTYLISAYEYLASQYAELIDKYDALMQKRLNKKYRKSFIKSQKFWMAYQKQFLSLYGLPNNENYEIADKRLKMNKERLEEIYSFYSDWLHGRLDFK
ncbi:MAG: hypothetical protein WCR52_10975 [Bacteroidota bacterium]